MGTFAEAYGREDFSVYHGSTVPVVPNTFPNEPIVSSPTYAKIGFSSSDLADGSTPSARDRLKELGLSLVEVAGKAVYGSLAAKAGNQDTRTPPTTGFPASQPQPPGGVYPPSQEGNILDGFAQRAGLTKGQLLVFVVLMGLLLFGIMKDTRYS